MGHRKVESFFFSLSSTTTFLAVSEKQCGICLAITFNSVARALALRLSVSMVMVYSLQLFRHVSSSFRMVNEPSLEYLSDESLSMLVIRFLHCWLLVKTKTV